MYRASTSKAFSVYKQSAQYQRPMHTASTTLNATLTSMHSSSTSMLRVSTTNERNINAQSINNQCALYQQPMRISSDSLMPGFSSQNTFTLCSMPLKPVILRGAEGKVAESILPESTLSRVFGGIVLKDPSRSSREIFFPPQRALSRWERGDRLRWVRVMIASN